MRSPSLLFGRLQCIKTLAEAAVQRGSGTYKPMDLKSRRRTSRAKN
jgi:hypothetical protein